MWNACGTVSHRHTFMVVISRVVPQPRPHALAGPMLCPSAPGGASCCEEEYGRSASRSSQGAAAVTVILVTAKDTEYDLAATALRRLDAAASLLLGRAPITDIVCWG